MDAIAAGRASLQQGPISVGGKLASTPVHRADGCALNHNGSSSRLCGKRLRPMGTILYGFPAQRRLTRTVNGIPDFETIDENTDRTVKLELTLCAPVHGPQPDKPKADAIARGGWSAACVPYSNLGKDRKSTRLNSSH